MIFSLPNIAFEVRIKCKDGYFEVVLVLGDTEVDVGFVYTGVPMESNTSVDVLLAEITVVVTVILAVKSVNLNSVPAHNGFAQVDPLTGVDRLVWVVVVLAEKGAVLVVVLTEKGVWLVVVLVDKGVGLVDVQTGTVVGITFVLMNNGVDLDSVLTYGFAVDGLLAGTVVDLMVVVADNGEWLTVLLPGIVVGVEIVLGRL